MEITLIRTLAILLITLMTGIGVPYSADTDSVNTFLSSLNKEQLKKATLEFESGSRIAWHYLPYTMWERQGILLNDLNEEQKSLAFAMVETYLGRAGYHKARQIIDLETVLAGQSGNHEMRDPGKYAIAIYGEPSDAEWAWSFEGHHLSLNFTIINDEVAFTPRFLGANPAEVRSGDKKGLRVLANEEDLGYQLLNSLSKQQQETALITHQAFTDIVTTNLTEANPLNPAGIGMTELNSEQQSILFKLIDEYLSAMPQEIATKRMDLLKEEDFHLIHFGWAGSKERGEPHYYRVHGKTFLIEFDNTQNMANHIHTVWRDFEGDFGRDLIREHYKTSHHHH